MADWQLAPLIRSPIRPPQSYYLNSHHIDIVRGAAAGNGGEKAGLPTNATPPLSSLRSTRAQCGAAAAPCA